MTSRRVLRGLWIAAAGSCIALGAGAGVATASTDSNGAGAQSSSAQSASTQQSTGTPPAGGATGANGSVTSVTGATSANGVSDLGGGSPVVGAASGGGKNGAEKSGEKPGGGATSGNQPSTAVSATTVTIRRDDTKTDNKTDTKNDTKAVVGESTQTATSAPLPQGAGSPATSSATATATPTATLGAPKDPPLTPVEVIPDVNPIVSPVVNPVVPLVVSSGSDSKITADVVQQVSAVTSQVAAPVPVTRAAPTPGPIATVVISLLSAFGLMPPVPAAPAPVIGLPVQPTPGTSQTNGVTGVKVGSSNLDIPVGTSTYTGAADWYFPTQADGTVKAQGVMLLQHGFLGSKEWYSALAAQLAQQTNSVVVVPNVPSFSFFTCAGCSLSDVALQKGVATLFADPNRAALTRSAAAAGYQGLLPDKFVLTGHSAGGALAAAAGGFYSDTVAASDNDLLGVVMFDGVSGNGTFPGALASLGARNIPVYQIAAPPQPWNANGQTTTDLVALRPGQFVGATLAGGSHVDSLIGGSPIIDFFSQLLIKRSPPGNTQAVYTLATGWINDLYAGRGPANPLYGTYGAAGQYVVLGQTAAVVLGPPPIVDVNRYLGTWYEVGSVKQFFSFGLVNTTAVYSLNPDGTIRVENSGNYFFDNGPKSSIVGVAVPVSPTANDKLNVSFFGAPASATPPGNYWIVDLAPDYSWAVVTDSTGSSGFLLSRTKTVSAAFYQELLDRASVKGVTGQITPTPQFVAAPSAVSA